MFDTNTVKASEMRVIQRWIAGSFYGAIDPGPEIKVIKYEGRLIGVNKSLCGDKITIGGMEFDRGLSTHVDVELLVALPKPAKVIRGKVGMDNPTISSVPAKACHVTFSAEVDGKSLWQSPPLSVGETFVDIPAVALGGETSFTLKAIVSGGDKSYWVFASWADVQVEMEDGEIIWLDEVPISTMRLKPELPFSFSVGKECSRAILERSRKEVTTEDHDGYKLHRLVWQMGGTGIELTCELKEYEEFPAMEWVLFLKNIGDGDSPNIDNVVSSEINFFEPEELTLHCAYGSAVNAQDFVPFERKVVTYDDVLLGHYEMCSVKGRPSQRFLPFWNTEMTGRGFITGLGWSGDWRFDLDLRTKSNPKGCTSKVSMPQLNCYLKPGEQIRTARMLILYWEGDDRLRGHNLFRRLMRKHYTPKWGKVEPLNLIGTNPHLNYDLGEGNESQMLKFIDEIAVAGSEMFWLDAGWYYSQGHWFEGVGNWFPDKDRFPRGLRPLGERCRKKGLQFCLWFEPERVGAGTKIHKEHPEWLISMLEQPMLFNFGIPEARQYMIEEVSKMIDQGGVDIYRHDANINPAPHWRAADELARQGITENKYVEGLYMFWDALRARFPHLLIDNCSSGGRRIDLETSMRSVPLWRSDVQCELLDKGKPTKNQSQMMGLSLYLPIHLGGNNIMDTYSMRSSATQGIPMGVDLNLPMAKYKKVFDEIKRYRHLFYADFYPLTEVSTENTAWAAFQYNSPELGEGFVLIFRREKSPFVSAEFELQGLDPAGTYEIIDVDAGTTKVGTGIEIGKLGVKLPRRGSRLFLYKVAEIHKNGDYVGKDTSHA